MGFAKSPSCNGANICSIGALDITAQKVRHWGARTFYDHHRGFNAYLHRIAGKRRVLYGGDTAYHTGFNDIGKVDLAIFGIGAYDPYEAAHATPEQAWMMADHVLCRSRSADAPQHVQAQSRADARADRTLNASGGKVGGSDRRV